MILQYCHQERILIMFAKLILTAFIFIFSESLYATNDRADTSLEIEHLDVEFIEILPNLSDRKRKQLWFEAAEMNIPQLLEELHKMVDMNAKDSRGRTVAHVAVMHRRYGILRKLKELGGDYLLGQARDRDGRVPLHYAASFGDSTAIRTLADLEVDLEARNKSGLTPILEVLLWGGWEVAQAQEAFNTLVKLGANLNVEDNNGVRASKLAQNKGWIEETPNDRTDKNVEVKPVNLQEHIYGSQKKKLWFEAAEMGNLPLLEELHTIVDMNAKRSSGYTAAHLAVMYHQYGVLRKLKDLGGDYLLSYARMSGGLAPLHAAAINGDLIAIRTLVDLGAYLEVTDAQGMTPLFWTLAAGRQEAFNTLVELGANTDVESKSGRGSLEIAREWGWLPEASENPCY